MLEVTENYMLKVSNVYIKRRFCLTICDKNSGNAVVILFPVLLAGASNEIGGTCRILS